jgi:hypothetical protein
MTESTTFPYPSPVDLIKPPEVLGWRRQCVGCGFVKDGGRFPRTSNRTRTGRNSRCHLCNALYQRDREKALGGAERARARDTERRRIVRTEVIDIYGGRCAECGSAADLEFDHVNGDGKVHRATETPQSWLVRIARLGERDPQWEIQLLCRPHHIRKTVTNRRRATALPA